MSLLEENKTYAATYPDLVALTEKHERAHWGTWEVKLQQDVEDWKMGRLSEQEKKFITSILRLFTQSDVSVGMDYYNNLIPVFENNEVRNLFGSYANREGTHQRAYALLNDTLGFGEDFYSEFLQFKEMAAKIDFMTDVANGTNRDIAVSLAKQTLIEGVMLFASFAMLLNFARFGKLPGMTDVNQWSIRDESMHVEGLSTVFRIFLKEHPEIVDDSFKKEIYSTARKVIEIEDAVIDLSFKFGAPEGITKEEVKQYIRAVADYRMQQLGFKPEYNVENPFSWLDWITSSTMVENFFESNTTAYSKNSMKGSYAGGY